MIRTVFAALARADETWHADADTAKAELGASGAQANVVAAHAFAWRASVALLPVGLVIAGAAVFASGFNPVAALVLAFTVPVLGPQALALLITYPMEVWGSLQALFRGRDNFVRFGFTNASYPYYGWRYAFCDRRRPWGALTHEEQVAQDPRRAGVHAEPPPRRNYWPE